MSCSLKHGDLLVEIDEVGLVQLQVEILGSVWVFVSHFGEKLRQRGSSFGLNDFLSNLFALFSLGNLCVVEFAELHEVVDHVLRNLNRSLGVTEGLLVTV